MTWTLAIFVPLYSYEKAVEVKQIGVADIIGRL